MTRLLPSSLMRPVLVELSLTLPRSHRRHASLPQPTGLQSTTLERMTLARLPLVSATPTHPSFRSTCRTSLSHPPLLLDKLFQPRQLVHVSVVALLLLRLCLHRQPLHSLHRLPLLLALMAKILNTLLHQATKRMKRVETKVQATTSPEQPRRERLMCLELAASEPERSMRLRCFLPCTRTMLPWRLIELFLPRSFHSLAKMNLSLSEGAMQTFFHNHLLRPCFSLSFPPSLRPA